jgi:hypothetical protein
MLKNFFHEMDLVSKHHKQVTLKWLLIYESYLNQCYNIL